VDEGRPERLVPLPPQPDGVPWPTDEWPSGEPPQPAAPALGRLVAAMFDDDRRFGTTYAVVVAHRGRVVAERYGGSIEHWDQQAEAVGPETLLLSWSKAKSVLHALVGILVGEGRLQLDQPAPVPAWAAADDPRRRITVEQLLAMRDGLAWAEDYVDGERPDVIDMLFGSGAGDVAAYAEARPPTREAGAVFNYSSGTSNILSGVVARTVGTGSAYLDFIRDRLFDAIGMRSAEARLDDAGTFVASSYVYATARDFARFGYLYLRDGLWESQRVLPEGWVDHGRAPRPGSADPESGNLYGAHWWVVGDDVGSFWANGYEGQSTLVCPGLDLVVVRLGRSAAEQYPALKQWRADVVDAFRS
jgi:CubicO group peptidase (beta-lactamase class C family)